MSQQVNLFNPALVPQFALMTARNVAIAAGVALGLVIVTALASELYLQRQQAAYAAGQQALSAAQARVTTLAQQIAQQKPSAAIEAERAQAEALLASRNNALRLVGAGMAGGDGHPGFGEHLRGLARQSQDGLWLTQVVIGSQPGDMQIKGRTIDRALVADYVERLKAEKTFAGQVFGGLSMREGSVPAASAASANGAPLAAGGSSPGRPAPYIEFELTSTQSTASANDNRTDSARH